MNIPNKNQWIQQHNCVEYLRCKNGFFRHAKYLIWINMIWICNKIFGNKICKAKGSRVLYRYVFFCYYKDKIIIKNTNKVLLKGNAKHFRKKIKIGKNKQNKQAIKERNVLKFLN